MPNLPTPTHTKFLQAAIIPTVEGKARGPCVLPNSISGPLLRAPLKMPAKISLRECRGAMLMSQNYPCLYTQITPGPLQLTLAHTDTRYLCSHIARASEWLGTLLNISEKQKLQRRPGNLETLWENCSKCCCPRVTMPSTAGRVSPAKVQLSFCTFLP